MIENKNGGITMTFAEICETVMLVCFGLSWPISLIKNIKLKSAKGMNMQFILLIIVGYIAGISAKIIKGVYGFVFFMYILNIVIVSMNLIVYFINKHYDKMRENGNKFEKEKQVCA